MRKIAIPPQSTTKTLEKLLKGVVAVRRDNSLLLFLCNLGVLKNKAKHGKNISEATRSSPKFWQ